MLDARGIEFRGKHTAAIKAKAAAQGLTLEVWLRRLADEETPSTAPSSPQQAAARIFELQKRVKPDSEGWTVHDYINHVIARGVLVLSRRAHRLHQCRSPRRLYARGSYAPRLWAYEVRNSILMGLRRHRITYADAEEFLESVKGLPIRVNDPVSYDRLFRVADRDGLTVYDAAYLDLALREGLPLASLDNALCKAAENSGVALFQP